MLINVDGDSVPLGLPLTRMSLISPHLCCPNHISSASMVFEQTDVVMTWLICPGSITATRASLSIQIPASQYAMEENFIQRKEHMYHLLLILQQAN